MRLIVAIALGCALACGSSSSPSSIPQADACNQAAKAACTKIFGCTDTQLTLIQLVLRDQAMCETTVVQSCGSTGFECTAGQTYHGDKAQECKDQFNAQSCATLAAGIAAAGLNTGAAVSSLTVNLPACSQICTGGDAGASPGG